MRSVTYFVATSLDGFIAGPDGGDPSSIWPLAPDYLEHLVEHYPETLPGSARQAMGISGPGLVFDTVVEGRLSYEVGLAAGITDAYPHLRHLVVSTTLSQAADPAVEIVRADPVDRIRDLKNEPGQGIWIVGGAKLAGSLMGEIDQLLLKVSPFTLGAGTPLWDTGSQVTVRRWRLSREDVLESGVRFSAYDPVDQAELVS